MTKYQKSFEELEQVASKLWSSELSEIEANLSVIPLLLKTQDRFISLIGIQTPNLDRFFRVVELVGFPANLFLKHLAILADCDGEMLQRVSSEFATLFPAGELRYRWRDEPCSYSFRALPKRKFSNTALGLDGKGLRNEHPLDDLQKDAIVLLLFGSFHSSNASEIAASLAKCSLGKLLGEPALTSQVVRQRYFWFSRILRHEEVLS